MSLPYGILDFARYIHATRPNKGKYFYHWNYILWLANFDRPAHDKYLEKVNDKEHL